MNSDRKGVAKRFVPPALVDLVGVARLTVPFLRSRSLLRNNAKVRNRYAGQSVYVIGNGPSLKKTNLRSLAGCHAITMNHFELHPDKEALSIVAHCIGEPFRSATWEDPMPMIEGVRAASYWVNADAIPFFAGSGIGNLHYYFPGIRKNSLFMDGVNLTGLGLIFQSTAQMAIVIGMYLGFKKIYLLGLDHDWLVTRGYSPHFYEEPSHVPKADLSRFTYTEMIRISLDLFETYGKIAAIARRDGVEIRNLTETSYLDVFPRGDRG